MQKKSFCKGFTLIELSIVMLVIGLLVTSVFVGRDLMHVAALRSTVAQFEQAKTATNAFLSKFSYLPGDIIPTRAEAFGLTGAACPAPGCFGNGDGIITRNQAELGETTSVFYHLQRANMVAGDFTPATGFVNGGGGYTWYWFALGNFIRVNWDNITVPHIARRIYPEAKIVGVWHLDDWGGQFTGLPKAFMLGMDVDMAVNSPNSQWFDLLTPAQAYWIDAKMDNGVTGGEVDRWNVQGYSSSACLDDQGFYDLSREESICSIRIKFLK